MNKNYKIEDYKLLHKMNNNNKLNLYIINSNLLKYKTNHLPINLLFIL